MSTLKLIHGGKLGDTIYSIPAARALSKYHHKKVTYILTTGREWSLSAAESIKPLLLAQEFVDSVKIDFSQEKKYFDRERKDEWKKSYPDAFGCFDNFRWAPGIGMHLAISQAMLFGIAADFSRPWINLPSTISSNNKIVLHAHREYESNKATQPPKRFARLTANYPITIIGTEKDIHDCDPLESKQVEYIKPENMLHAAEIIQSGKVFIGGDHSPLALAVGLWKPTIAEVFSPLNNTAPTIMPNKLWLDMQLSTDIEIENFIARHIYET